jgi:hypothetical protein
MDVAAVTASIHSVLVNMACMNDVIEASEEGAKGDDVEFNKFGWTISGKKCIKCGAYV